MDSEEKSTLGGHGSDAHLTRVDLEGTGSAHGGYDWEKRTRRIHQQNVKWFGSHNSMTPLF